MISNCGHDERGSYKGGKAGDQTGQEWEIKSWYNRPWKCVLRHPDSAVQNKMAELARKSAQNNLIGYDQDERYTFWQHLQASNYDPSKISVACEADCSSGVAAIVKAVGYILGRNSLKNVSIYAYTGNLRAVLQNAGFELLTASKYLTGDSYLLPGDVLLLDGHHTAINLDEGSNAGSNTPAKPPVSGDSYRVKAGDTLSKIAQIWGTTVDALATHNGIKNPNVIEVDQVLHKPAVKAKIGKIPITGMFDKATTEKAQQVFGLPIDGVISDQISGYKSLVPGILTAEWGASKNGGSRLVAAIQHWLSLPIDGQVGPIFIAAFCKKFGVPSDGTLSKPSQAITKFQVWLNEQ